MTSGRANPTPVCDWLWHCPLVGPVSTPNHSTFACSYRLSRCNNSTLIQLRVSTLKRMTWMISVNGRTFACSSPHVRSTCRIELSVAERPEEEIKYKTGDRRPIEIGRLCSRPTHGNVGGSAQRLLFVSVDVEAPKEATYVQRSN